MPNFFMISDTHINNFNYSINYNKDVIISVASGQADHTNELPLRGSFGQGKRSGIGTPGGAHYEK